MATYVWTDSSSNQTLTVSSPGVYWVNVTKDRCQASDTIGVSYRLCTGFEDVTNLGNLKIFPNPMKKFVKIQLPLKLISKPRTKGNIIIADMFGKTLVSQPVQPTTYQQIQLPPDLANAPYQLIISVDGIVLTEVLIKRR